MGRLVRRLLHLHAAAKQAFKRNPADLKYTDAGRKVYGGGGIEPDRYVLGPVEGFDPTRFSRLLSARQVFEKLRRALLGRGRHAARRAEQDRKIVATGLRGHRCDARRLPDVPRGGGVKIDEASFAKDLPFIRAMIRFQIDQALFGVDEARKRLLADDPQAQVALGLFAEAHQLAEAGRAHQSRGGALQ